MNNKIVCGLTAITIVMAPISCQSELPQIKEQMWEEAEMDLLTPEEAQTQFAVILSRALLENENLRMFLKEEALKEYDKDFDIFYPWSKDKYIGESQTFEDVLRKYDDGNLLDLIVKSEPKLTILIPDFSWVNEHCFSVGQWDTSLSEVAVGVDDSTREHTLYYNGEEVGTIPTGSFPSFPVLIVKSNERMKTLPITKGGKVMFDFVDECFNGMQSIYTRSEIRGTVENDGKVERKDLVSEVNDFVSQSAMQLISPESISAYNEFGTGTDDHGVARDYSFYGMTRTNNDYGTLKWYESELLYRFALNPGQLIDLSDDPKDPFIPNPVSTGRDDRPGFSEIWRRFWGAGKYEICIEFYQANKNHEVIKLPYRFCKSISAEDLMYVNQCSYVFHWNIFGNNWSTYSITEKDVEPKWYYPALHSYFFHISNPWDMSETSDNIWVYVSEVDDGAKITKDTTDTFKYSGAVKLKTDLTPGALQDSTRIKIGFGVSAEGSIENSRTIKHSVELSLGSDELNRSEIRYDDYVIGGESSGGFLLKRYYTGSFMFSMIPFDRRRETFITNNLNMFK